jgi:hypothetical protein
VPEQPLTASLCADPLSLSSPSQCTLETLSPSSPPLLCTGVPPASPSAGLSSSAADSECVRRLESELAACRARLVHVEHTARSRELAVDKLRSMLGEKVT